MLLHMDTDLPFIKDRFQIISSFLYLLVLQRNQQSLYFGRQN